MNETRIIKLQGEAGRIDKILPEYFPEMSRSTIQKAIQNDLILVDGQIVKANYKVKGFEEITCLPIEEKIEETLPLPIGQKIPLSIIYEDDDIIVINKQKGLVVHPSKGHPDQTLVNGLIYYFGNNLSTMNNAHIRPGIVHRIDKDTTGLLVVAKNNQSHEHLSKQLEVHSMYRQYIALVHGNFNEPNGTINIPLARNPKNRLKYTGQEEGKEAITHFEVLENFEEISLIQCRLETGRTHQIRAHLEFIGHPIVGDPVYRQGIHQYHHPLTHLDDGQLLHAKSLTFIHPKTHENLKFEAIIPSSFQSVIDELKA